MAYSHVLVALALTLGPAPASAAVTITGTIYCDNVFEFYFNGQLVKSDPITFTPHQAVSVSFTYDGTSPKTYAILCQDYASDSGYEYIGTSSPQLGDGALIAEFSDGTVTSTSWKSYVVTHGPTAASESAGCSASNLSPCAVADYGTPSNWFSTSFDDSSWAAATQYTAQEAGWGRTPAWSSSNGCCQPTSPVSRSNLGCCNCNSDGTASGFTSVTVTESECLNPETELGSSSASFIWGSSLTKDNKMLFRHTVSAPSPSSSPSPSPTPSPAPQPSPLPGATSVSPSPTPSPAPQPSSLPGATSVASQEFGKAQMLVQMITICVLSSSALY
eukprot:TRINITY_DN14475_c0_g1_i1.p1 TRINITY_DN14475_c0_g1~~TRINITY_DN14475_c0_g1_i1.p1  ORF type:complete len:347 (+),score=29.76 TRINITY_DN14475_c0_g1_i1:51-1043(+)